MQDEIERKWLLTGIIGAKIQTAANQLIGMEDSCLRIDNELDNEKYKLTYKKIKQTYILKTKNSEVRIREVINLDSKKKHYTQTVKMGAGITRKEDEIDIDIDNYERMMKSEIATINKIRLTVSKSNTDEVIDIDVYDNGLCTMEVEFPSEEIAMSFDVNSLFLSKYVEKEITGNKDYSNFRMALLASGVKQ